VLTIRPTQAEDAFRVSVCISKVARERLFLATTSGFNPLLTRDYLKFLKKKGGIHLIALDGDIVVGWCDVTPGMFEGFPQVGRLGIGLLPEYRGKGLGRSLLCRTIEAAFMSSVERIELEVFSSNLAAISLYRSAGFREEGRKPKGRKFDGRGGDVILFGLFREEWQMHEVIIPEEDGEYLCISRMSGALSIDKKN
jgi:ribosomal protein S18 acetylase RimI-like enzyme